MENRILCFAECRFPKFSSEGLTLRNTEASLIEHNRLLSTRNVSRIIMIHGGNHPIRKSPFSSIHSKGGNYVNEVQTKKISLLKNMQIRVDGELHHTPVTAASYRLVAQSVDKRQV